jgi:predicted NAD/FAD-binding protein
MLVEIRRFNRMSVADRSAGVLEGLSLGAYLHLRNFTARFRDDYLIPMGAAIWSMSAASMLSFPAESFIAFFQNHHLLQWNRPAWRTVTGGSRSYVEKLTACFRDSVRLGAAVTSIERSATGVTITDATGETAAFDQVVLAAHSDQSLAMLGDATADETSILGAIAYRDNAVYLHRDPALMPRRRRAWAAWNVMQGDDPAADLCVTYWMNALQGMPASKPLFVTLNPSVPPRADLTFGTYTYAHPQYTQAAISAQKRLPGIQGRNRTWYCGAWTRHGFHEDGLASGLAVAEALGGTVSWRDLQTVELAEAAE